MDETRVYTWKWRTALLIVFMCVTALFAAPSIKTGDAVMVIAGAFLLAVMGGIFAVLFLTGRNDVITVLGASVTVVILQVLGGFAASLMGGVVLLAAFALGLGVKKHILKTSAVIVVSLVLGGGFLLIASVLYALDGGSLVPEELLAAYNKFFAEMKVVLSEQVRVMFDSLGEEFWTTYERMEITKEEFLETYLESMAYTVDLIQLMVPGILLLSVQVLAYFEITMFRVTARFARVDSVLPEIGWHLYPTQISCVIYIVVSTIYMIASFFAESTSSFMVLIGNFWMTLLPMMLFCGMRVFFARLKHPLYRMSTIIILFVFAFGLFAVPAAAIQIAAYLLSFLGAQTVSAQRTLESEKNKNNR